MKKLLLSVLGVVSVNAYQVNDFFYTPTAKFKVMGENLVANGTFADGITGWLNQEGAEVSAVSWQWTAGAGPNGENVMMSLSADAGNVLARMFELQPGSYSISYQIKGDATSALSNEAGYGSYGAFYVNADGSLATNTRLVSDRDAYGVEWKEITDTVSISAGEYLVMYFDQMAVGTMVTNFEIHEVAQVYDTRVIEKELAWVKSLMANENFTEQGELPDVVGAIEAALQGDTSFGIDFSEPSGIAGIEDFLTQNYYPNKDAFLAANSADMLPYISKGDISTWTKFNNGDGKKSEGDWKFSGTTMRWGHASGAVDGNLSYPGNYDLFDGTCMIEKAGLKAGKYLFSLETRAEKYFKTKTMNSWYEIDYTTQAPGGKIFIGTDSIEVGKLSVRDFTRYTIIADVKEGDTLRAGFRFPGFEAGAGGGSFKFTGAVLRLIGESDAQIALEQKVKDIATAQNSLKVMIDSAKTVTAKTAEYPWGMDALVAAIPTYEDYLNSTYAIVDANGNNVSLTVDLTDEQKALPDSLNTKMSGMRTAIQNLYALNQPIYDIAEAIAYHRGEIASDLYKDAAASARANYEASIAAAEALKASVTTMDATAAADEKAKFEAAIADMTAKEVLFKKTCASYAAPAPETIAAPDFTGQTNKALPKNGWTGVNGNSMRNQDWKYATWNVEGREEYGRGYVNGWRGQVATPRAKVSQTVSLETEGVYEMTAFAYGANESSKYWSYFTIIADEETGTSIDTTFVNGGHKIFMGPTGVPDSTTTHSQYLTDLYRPSKYATYYVKEGNDPIEIELGFESVENGVWTDKAGANMWGFGGVNLNYCGTVDKYTTALDADLAAKVAEAQAILATEAGSAEVNKWMAIKINRYIADAAAATTLTAKRNTLFRLVESMERMNLLITGIEGVEAESVINAEAKGVYSITGVKLGNKLNDLQKGLYIINGKKYIVK